MLTEKRKQRTTRIIVFALLLTVTAWLLPGNLWEAKAESAKMASASTSLNNPRINAKADRVTWDCVYFGHYPQSRAIKWRVLSVNGNDAFLLADKVLAVQPYHKKDQYVTWADCTLRSWLNSTFLNSAFNSAEKNAILLSNVANRENPYYKTPGGDNTRDKVYLLSIQEATNPVYGFSKYYEDSNTRAMAGVSLSGYDGAESSWWLRSPGDGMATAASVASWGFLYFRGGNVNDYENAVRPVLHLKLSSGTWSYAGTVSCSGGKDVARGLPAAKTIKLNKTKATLYRKSSVQLKATVTPAAAAAAELTWSSSNRNIASVSQSGKVTGIKKGTATITAKTSSGKTAKCKVTVR